MTEDELKAFLAARQAAAESAQQTNPSFWLGAQVAQLGDGGLRQLTACNQQSLNNQLQHGLQNLQNIGVGEQNVGYGEQCADTDGTAKFDWGVSPQRYEAKIAELLEDIAARNRLGDQWVQRVHQLEAECAALRIELAQRMAIPARALR